jgi:hypothetical protein
MKKVSTAATRQSKNFSQPNLTVGLDMGDRSSCLHRLWVSGEVYEPLRNNRAMAMPAAA